MHNKLESCLKVGSLLLHTLTFTLLNSIWFTSYVCLRYSAKLRVTICHRVFHLISISLVFVTVWRHTESICCFMLCPICTLVFLSLCDCFYFAYTFRSYWGFIHMFFPKLSFLSSGWMEQWCRARLSVLHVHVNS